MEFSRKVAGTHTPPCSIYPGDTRYYKEVVSKHSGGSGKDSVPRKLEEGKKNQPESANPAPESATAAATIPANNGIGAGENNYKRLPPPATSALAGVGRQRHAAEEPGGAGTGAAQQGNGDASRSERSPLEFAMV